MTLTNMSKKMLRRVMITSGRYGSKLIVMLVNCLLAIRFLMSFWNILVRFNCEAHVTSSTECLSTSQFVEIDYSFEEALHCYNACQRKDTLVILYLNSVTQLGRTLRFMNFNVDDKEISMAVLNDLPSNFEQLIFTIDTLGNNYKLFTFDLEKSQFLQEQQCSRMRDRKSIKNMESSAPFPRSACLR